VIVAPLGNDQRFSVWFHFAPVPPNISWPRWIRPPLRASSLYVRRSSSAEYPGTST
jgi:hypothetical protein